MRKIEIRYKTFLFFKKKIEILSPSETKDLNKQQFLLLYRSYFNDISDVDLIADFYCLDRKIAGKLSDFEIFKLKEIIFKAFEIKGTNRFFIRRLKGGLMLPKDMLQDVTLEQFAIFDTLYFEYLNDGTEENLVRFVSALALRRGEVISKIDFEKRMRYIKKHISSIEIQGIMLNYLFIKIWLADKFKMLFESGSGEENKKKGKEKKYLPDWNRIIDSVVGDDVLRYEDYIGMPCIRAFKLLEMKLRDYKKVKSYGR